MTASKGREESLVRDTANDARLPNDRSGTASDRGVRPVGVTTALRACGFPMLQTRSLALRGCQDGRLLTPRRTQIGPQRRHCAAQRTGRSVSARPGSSVLPSQRQ